MVKSFVLFALGAFALCHTGCVTPLDVKSSAFPVPATKSPTTILAGVVDNRPYVLSGRKSDRYEGIMHDGFGLPHNMNNIEKKPFSSYLGDRMVAGFQNAEYKTEVLILAKGATDDEILRRISKSNSERTFVLRLNDWRFDWGGFIVPTWQFFYNVEIQVFDRSLGLLTRRTFSGVDTPAVKASDSILNNSLVHYQKKFGEFMADSSIVAALAGKRDSVLQSGKTRKERLEELERLLQAGLISNDEYSSLRQKILQEILEPI